MYRNTQHSGACKEVRVWCDGRNSNDFYSGTGEVSFLTNPGMCELISERCEITLDPPPPPDSDGDGIPNASDLCPDTPSGKTVCQPGQPYCPCSRQNVLHCGDECIGCPKSAVFDEEDCM